MDISLRVYADAFQRKGSPLQNVVMTIDGTKQLFSSPGHGLQNACYCGHAHSHCLGYQFIELPTGGLTCRYSKVFIIFLVFRILLVFQLYNIAYTRTSTSVDTLVLILGKSP